MMKSNPRMLLRAIRAVVESGILQSALQSLRTPLGRRHSYPKHSSLNKMSLITLSPRRPTCQTFTDRNVKTNKKEHVVFRRMVERN